MSEGVVGFGLDTSFDVFLSFGLMIQQQYLKMKQKTRSRKGGRTKKIKKTKCAFPITIHFERFVDHHHWRHWTRMQAGIVAPATYLEYNSSTNTRRRWLMMSE
jgi:hypothetical protein